MVAPFTLEKGNRSFSQGQKLNIAVILFFMDFRRAVCQRIGLLFHFI